MSYFEASSLPDPQKRAMCEELLAEFGARISKVSDKTGEMVHGCLVAPELHRDQDRNPTASLNYQKLTYNCLQGDTLVKTRGGEFPIRELAGGVHQLLDGEGRWVSAPVKEYGVDRLYRVTLSRNGVRKEIYATADHRWYIRPKGTYDRTSLVETTTLDLRPRQRIPSVWTMTRTGRTMEHRRRYEESQQRRTYERTNWWVVSVEETDRVESVYCAEVASTHSFVLADNVLTGNCLGCGSSGGLLWFIATCRGETSGDARQWLEKTAGLGGQVLELDAMLRFLDSVYARPQSVPIPNFSTKLLDAWAYDHPYFTEARGISPEVYKEYRLGWDPKTDRVVLPHFWMDKLVGWQTRKLPMEWRSVELTPESLSIHSGQSGSPKYHSSPDFPKESTIFNYQPKAREVVVMEAMLSALTHEHVFHSEAVFGAKVTELQIRRLVKHDLVILWMDNDTAGWRAVEGRPEVKPTRERPQGQERIVGMAELLAPYTEVKVVNSPWSQDPNELPTEEAVSLRDSAVPWSHWRRPEGLSCFHCRRDAHEGACAN